jgi:hypothetical protein
VLLGPSSTSSSSVIAPPPSQVLTSILAPPLSQLPISPLRPRCFTSVPAPPPSQVLHLHPISSSIRQGPSCDLRQAPGRDLRQAPPWISVLMCHLAVQGSLPIMDINVMFDLSLCPPPEEDDQNHDAGIELPC